MTATMSPEYALIPELTIESLRLYREHRCRPGDFLTAVLCNDLFEAFGRADDENAAAMRQICKYIYNEVPSRCWGSRERVAAWLEDDNPTIK